MAELSYNLENHKYVHMYVINIGIFFYLLEI